MNAKHTPGPWHVNGDCWVGCRMPESPEWTKREVDAPVSNYVTIDQFADLFGMSEETVLEYVERGILPKPLKYSRKFVRFHWRVVVMFDLWKDYFPLPDTDAVKEKRSEK